MVSDRQKRRRRIGSTVGTVAGVIFLFIVFVIAVKWFRSEPPAEEPVVDSIVDVLKPDPISQAVIDGGIDTESREAALYWTSTGERIGTATRGEKDNRYYLELKTSLPEIDRELYYYQVWLLRRLPYDFFSIGEMVTDEDGYFVLEWEALDDEDYSGYEQVVITRNVYGESAEPEIQLVKGKFGN